LKLTQLRWIPNPTCLLFGASDMQFLQGPDAIR